jgi:hypothetical protein
LIEFLAEGVDAATMICCAEILPIGHSRDRSGLARPELMSWESGPLGAPSWKPGRFLEAAKSRRMRPNGYTSSSFRHSRVPRISSGLAT